MASTSQPVQSIINSLTGGTQFEQRDVHDLRGMTAVVTGGSAGIGFEVTKALALAGARVILLSRKADRAEEAISQIKTIAAEDASNTLDIDVEFKECDLGNLKDVKQVGDAIRENEQRLDLLICDAGIGVNKFALSSDGIDRHFAVNVLGHFLLTNRLLPLIRHTARLPGSQPPRIISVSSSLHQATPSDIKFQSLEELNNPDLRTDVYYDRSKLALILHTKYGLVQRVIAPHQDSIYALATHPGAVHTDQQDQFKEAYGPVFGTMLKGLVVPFMRNPEQGSLSTLWAATSPEVIQKDYQGVYVQNPGYIGGESKQAQDPELGENLWKLNNQLILEKLGKDGLLPWDQVKQ